MEQALIMSLGNREGEACEETEPEELPEKVKTKVCCESQENGKGQVRPSVMVQKGVFFLPEY